MPNVNISFSGGVESMALLQLAMEKGHNINLVIQNLSGTPEGTVAELLTTRKTIAFFRDHPDKEKYKGKISEVYYMIGLPHLNRPATSRWDTDRLCDLVTNCMSQQWGCIQNLMVFRQASILKGAYPATWIGWMKEDAADYNHEECDFTTAELQEMLQIPTRIGVLGSGDRVARPFRAPLWDMTKREIWDYIDPDIRDNAIPNGKGYYDCEYDVITHTPHGFKKTEYKEAGIPIKDTYKFDATSEGEEFRFFLKQFMGQITPLDLDLPPEARTLVQVLAKKIVEPNCWIDTDDIQKLKRDTRWVVEEAHKAAFQFTWPVPIPTVEILADIGEGAERVELEGDQ